jgi:predicted  nucleic acid-binding Zn-ribbon protein
LSPELSQLLSLQDADQEIKRISEQIASFPTRQQTIEQQFEESASELLLLKREFESALTARTRLENDLASEQEKLEKFKADLMRATNEREYTTAVREIDVAKRAISAFETELLKLMEKTEKLEEGVLERTPELDTRRAEFDKQLDEIAIALEKGKQRLSAVMTEREQLYSTLSGTARSIYDRASRLRGGVVLAEARDYACQACRMKIRPQVFNDIRRGDAIVTCESCARVLYFLPAQV